jgi:ribosomal protein L40E
MKRGTALGQWNVRREGESWLSLLGVIPFICKSCDYIELYKENPQREEAFLKRCVKCGKDIPIASEECQYCGTKQPKSEE